MRRILILMLLLLTMVGCSKSSQAEDNTSGIEVEDEPIVGLIQSADVDSITVSIWNESPKGEGSYVTQEETDEALLTKYLHLFIDLEEYQMTTGDYIRSIAPITFFGEKDGSGVNYMSVLGEYENNYVIALTTDPNVAVNREEIESLLVFHVPLNSEKGQEITDFVNLFK